MLQKGMTMSKNEKFFLILILFWAGTYMFSIASKVGVFKSDFEMFAAMLIFDLLLTGFYLVE